VQPRIPHFGLRRDRSPVRRRSAKTVAITGLALAAVTVLVVAWTIAYLVARPFSVQDDDAERLIRHYLRYQASQRYAELYKTGKIDAQAAKGYQARLDAIAALRFESVDVGRLFPDYLFSDGWPTYYAKAVMRDAQGRTRTRYFNLGTGQLVVGESSRVVWHFVL
jgi:hypothetical protein